MALCNLLSVLSLLSSYPFLLQAQISFPRGNVTYWPPGSLVKLPWTYNIPTANILAVEITFTKYGSSKPVSVADGFNGANPTSKDASRFTIEGQATLVFQNANANHNGTYTLGITLRNNAGQRKSDAMVVILEQPIAKKTCHANKNGNFYCVCKSDVGNPPPLAYWSKNGKKIGDFGYKEKKLILDNITKGEPAIYSCIVKSYNLTNQVNISLEAPNITSFVSDPKDFVNSQKSVTFACKADGILPTMFNISFNGKDPERMKNGVKTIAKFTKDNIGSYECIAFNIIGSNSSQLNLNATKAVSERKSILKLPGVLPGIIIGILVVLIITIVLVYRFCCKRDGGCPKGKKRKEQTAEDDSDVHMKVNQGSTSYPDVYAVVDKGKKKKKKDKSIKRPPLTYASLDPVVLKPDCSKMRDVSREETAYASINPDCFKQSDQT